MATLTGFKSVGESQQQLQSNGQQNPVFVFDELDVGDNAASETNEIYVDASSDAAAIKQPPVIDNELKRDTVTIEISNATAQDDESPAVPKTPPAEHTGGAAKRATSATANQIHKVAGQQQQANVPPRQQRAQQQQQNLLTPNDCPNGAGDGDNTSMSMLAIDCAAGGGTGKSPRQPRRSPLMALFRGKPRESVRKLYTDEDQFEIEWANLSLEVQKKWYQKLNLSNLLAPDHDEQSTTTATSQAGKLGVNKPQSKLILNKVDGRIRSGEITAVLGPSGAGKTSLLNGLFGKYRTAVQGSIKVTGAPSKKHLTVCTIPQSDYLIGYLTTEESLWFASRLKNCEFDFNHDRNIERVIELLGLQRCRHTRINKLSGGQYKRVSIAQEMLSSPDILVLDEPTSGLDSLTCYRTVKVLRDLVEASKAHNLVNPMSIILTIHQPHREVLDLFHSVYIMAVGGQTLYQGPPADMEDWINKYSGATMPAQGYNPASFMVELASEEYGRKPIDTLVALQRQKFRETTQHQYSYELPKSAAAGAGDVGAERSKQQSNNYDTKVTDSTITLYPLGGSKNDNYVDVDLSASDTRSQSSSATKDIDSRIMTPRSGKNSNGVFWHHVSLMSKRCFLSNTRDPLLFTIRVGAHIFIPLVVALIYGPKMGIPNGCPFYKPEIDLMEYASMGVEEIQGKHDDIRIQFQNVGLHFMVYYAFGLCMLAFTAISFPLIMHVLVKEIRNGWYSLSTFIMGKMLAELPMALILPPISVGIIYVMTGQPSSYLQWRYLVQSVILILIIMIAEAKGLVFGAVCMNSMQTAVFAASVSTVPFILLSGFLIRIREVPYVLQHFAKFSYFKHSVEALIITRYGYGMCPCDQALIPPGGTPRIIGIPPQIMSLTDYYISAIVASPADNSTTTDVLDSSTETNVVGNNRNISRIISSITTLSPEIGGASGDETTTATSLAEEPPSTTTAPSLAAEPPSTTTAPPLATEPPSTTTAPPLAEEPPSTTESSGPLTRARRAEPTTSGGEEETDAENSTERPVKQGLFFDKLASLLTRANAFGYSIQSCADVEPFTMKDMQLSDSMLPPLIGYLFLYIVILKFISYFIVEICVKLKL